MTAIAYRLTNSRITNLNFVVTTALAVLTALIIFTLDIRLVLALFVVPWFIFFFYKKPMILVCLWPLVSLVETFFIWIPVRVGGIRVLPMDPVYFFTLSVLGVRLVAQPKTAFNLLSDHKYVVMFFGMIMINVLLYTPVNGQSAIGEARKYYFLFVFPLLAAMSIKTIADLKKVLFVLAGAGVVVAAAAAYRAVALHTFVRVLNAEATLILALLTFALLVCWINRVILITPVIHGALLAIVGLFAIGSGQRSVWLSIGVGSCLLLFLYRKQVTFIFKALTLTGALVVAGTITLIAFPRIGERLAEKFSGIVNPYEDKTASWRIKGWEAQLGRVTEVNPLFGEGLGGYYSWKLGSHEINFQPHNAYVQMMLKFGMVGLALYSLIIASFFRTTLALRRKLRYGPLKAFLEIGILGFGAGHGYMIGYAIEPIILIYFGIATSTVALYQQALTRGRRNRVTDMESDDNTAKMVMRSRYRIPSAF